MSGEADFNVQAEPLQDVSGLFDADASVPDIADDIADSQGDDVTGEELPESTGAEGVKQKYTLKIDGKDEEVELSGSELIAQLQKARFADQRFNEAGMIEKKSKELYSLFQRDPYAALSAMGHDPEQLAEDLVYAKARRSLMTSEEQQVASLQEELAMLREKDSVATREKQDSEVAAIQQQIVSDIDRCLQKANLPLSPDLRRQVVRYMAEADRLGYEVSAEDVLDYAVDDYKESLSELFGSMEAEKLLEFFGDTVAGKIRKHDIEKAKKPFTTVVKRGASGAAAPKAAARRSFSTDEFLKSL